MAADKEIDVKWNDVVTLKVEHQNNIEGFSPLDSQLALIRVPLPCREVVTRDSC